MADNDLSLSAAPHSSVSVYMNVPPAPIEEEDIRGYQIIPHIQLVSCATLVVLTT